MSLMNCAFTVRWSDEKNKPQHGVRSVDIAVKINNKPAGSLKDDNPSETEAEQKGFWWQE